MKEIICCPKCSIEFKQISLLSLKDRLENHQRIPHTIECAECEDTFISHSHLRYHLETQHDARCGDCCSFCNRTCSIQYATVTELTAAWGMEEGIAGKQEAVAGAMESLEQCIRKKTRSHMKMVEDMARRMDSGFDGIEGID